MDSEIYISVFAVLCDDIESLETLLLHLNSKWRRESLGNPESDLATNKVIPILADLVERGFAETMLYSETSKMLESVDAEKFPVREYASMLWYRLTPKGKEICHTL